MSPFDCRAISEAVVRYMTSGHVPILAWLDNFHVTGARSTYKGDAADRARRGSEGDNVLGFIRLLSLRILIDKCQLTPSTRRIYLVIVCAHRSASSKCPETSWRC